MDYTPLNLEQSLARYLADKFKSVGYSVYWHDTKQTEGTGTKVTIVRKFPPQATQFVKQSSTQASPGAIKVPAFSMWVQNPKQVADGRMGLGDSEFLWNANARIDGFADTELEWYKIRGWFRDWFGVDVRTSVYNYQANINSTSPSELNYQMQYLNTDINGEELDETPAVRYYINCLTTLEFVA